MWLARNKDGSLRIFARPPRRFHDGAALESQKVGFNDAITLGNDDYSFWAVQEYCDSNRIDDFRNYGIDIRTEIIRNGEKHFIPYIPECARHITWEDEPIEVEIIPIENFVTNIEDTTECDYLFPQSHWKPSDEQIEILDMVLTNESMDDNIARILRELREQLKKLREDKL